MSKDIEIAARAALNAKKIDYKIEKAKIAKDLTIEALKNPVVELVTALVLIETLQKAKLVGETAGTIFEGGIVTTILGQQLSNAPDLLKTVTMLGGMAGTALAGALAAGGTVAEVAADAAIPLTNLLPPPLNSLWPLLSLR